MKWMILSKSLKLEELKTLKVMDLVMLIIDPMKSMISPELNYLHIVE